MVYLPADSTIAAAKLRDYLLTPLPKDDKSKFLSMAGYERGNWQQLERDLRNQILPLEAKPIENTKHGQKYQIIGTLTGPNNTSLQVKTIWIQDDEVTRLVTLVPEK